MDKGIKRVAEVAKGIVNLLLGADAVLPVDRVRPVRNSVYTIR